MPKIGKVYRHNRVKTRQMVPKRFIVRGGKEFVRADSCTSQLQLVIPVTDIHDEPHTSGWSLIRSEASSGSNEGGK